MTRTRNGSLQATYDYDADVDAPIFARVLREIAQDLHMLFDTVTGENSPGSAPAVQVIDHSGADGAGSLLGMTSWQQPIWVRPFLHESDLDVYAQSGGSIVLLAKPHWVCDGENVLVVEVDADEDAADLYCEVYDSSGVLITSQSMDWTAGDTSEAGAPRGNGTWRSIFQFTTTGVQTFVAVRRVYEQGRNWCALQGWRGFAGRIGGAAPAPFPGGGGTAFPVTTGATGIAWELLHDEMFAADQALAGHLTTKLNRMINGLWEYVTGAPVPGNGSLQQTYFKEARRNAYSSEPLPQLPLFGEGIGAFGWDAAGEAWSLTEDADPPTEGMLAWHAPYPRTVSEATLHRCAVFFDDYDPTALWLKCTVLAASEMASGTFKYTPTAWEARVYNTQTASASSWTAFTQVGSLPLLAATFIVPYYGNAHNGLELRLRRPSGSFTFGELAILGWDFFFEP